MVKLVCFSACPIHSFNASLVERPDIDIQPPADSGDVFHIIGLIRHYRASSAGEEHICDIIYGHIIRDIVDQRHIFSDIVKTASEHIILLAKKQQICR